MPFPLRALRVPECSSCIGRLAVSVSENWFALPLQQQVRGKKKLAKDIDTRLKVRLLKDVPKYGRKGAIISLPRGLMRNLWYPRGKAEYMTRSQLKELDLKDSAIERDVTFMALEPSSKSQKGDSRNVGPQRATQILSNMVPPTLTFYRSPTATASQLGKSPPRTRAAASSAAVDLAGVPEPLPLPEPTGIYGSVSTADVAMSIRALLAADEESSRVVVLPEDITFTSSVKEEEFGDMDRVKHLGDFEVDIKVKGVKDPLRKTVRVLAEEKEVKVIPEEAGEK